MPPETRFYNRYGSHPAIASFAPHKSGITPLSPLHLEITLLSPTSREVRDELENFQRAVMRGYTSQFLLALDVISERPFALESEINIEIPAFMKRDRWNLAIPCEIDDEVVWAHMEGVLKLVSVMLANISRHPWFDALLCAEREPVPAHRFSARDRNRFPGDELGKCRKRFQTHQPWLIDPTETHREMERIATKVLEKHLSFGFMSQEINPLTGHPFEGGVKVDALTSYKSDMKVFIAWQLLALLLRTDLNEGERLAERVYVAKTILHELMHVFNFARSNFSAKGKYLGADYYRSLEPFFEDEAECEIGLSAETAIFGGPIRPILTHNQGEGKAHLGFFMTSHPLSESGSPLYDVPRLRNPGAPDPSLFIPIPLHFYQALCGRDFWNVQVTKYGMGLLGVSEAFSGSREVDGRYGVVSIDQYPDFKEREVKRLMGMSPEQRETQKRDMKAELVLRYQPLTVARDGQVLEVMNSAEHLGKLDKGSGNYSFFLESLVEYLEALIPIHESIVAYIPILEEDAGMKLVDTRDGIQGFHDHLRAYIASLLPNEDEEMQTRLEAMISQLDTLASSTLLEPFDPIAAVDATKYHLQSYETLLISALQSFDSSQFTQCKELCRQLTETLDVPIHIQAMARIKLAELEHLSTGERLENVRRAMSSFQALDLENVEEHLRGPVVDFANRGAVLVGELEQKEIEELADGFARGCGT